MGDNNHTSSDGISRRTVTKAIAWSVPAIAVATPIPAFAASGTKPRIVPGDACKSPGASGGCDWFKFGYGTQATVYNDSAKDIWICDVTIVSQSPASPTFTGKANLPVKVPAGGSAKIVFGAVSSNSANIKNGSITFSVGWGHSPDCTDQDHVDDRVEFTFTWAATPPTECPCL